MTRFKQPGEAIDTVLIEGSVFLGPSDVERIARAEACSVNADAAVITSEHYAVPFSGSQATVVLIRKAKP